MAEVDLGVLSWSITASDEQLDTVLASAAQKAQAWSARMRELTKVELQAEGVPEPVARPAGGPESRRPAPPRPTPPVAAPSAVRAAHVQQFVQQALAGRSIGTPEQQAASAQVYDPEGYRRAQRQAIREEAATRLAQQRQPIAGRHRYVSLWRKRWPRRVSRVENYTEQQQTELAQFFDPQGFKKAQQEAQQQEVAATRRGSSTGEDARAP
jgi:hypothetical protein